MNKLVTSNCDAISTPPPYHVFRVLDCFFVFDTSTVVFYEINEITYDFLHASLTMPLHEVPQELIKYGKYNTQQIHNVALEVERLFQSGLADIPQFILKDSEIEKRLSNVGTKNLRGLHLMLSETCNLACKYCFCETGKEIKSSNFMSQEIAQKAIKLLFHSEAQELYILFFGGEPLLNFETLKFAYEYSQALCEQTNKKITYSITSNGTLITDEIAAYLKEKNISILVSMDGPPELHNSQRPMRNGTGSYEMMLNGVRNLKKYGTSVQVCSVMTHPAFSLEELLNFIRSVNLFDRIIIGHAINPFSAANCYDFTEDDYKKYIQEQEKMLPALVANVLENGDSIDYFPYSNALGAIRGGLSKSKIDFFKCQAGRLDFTVSTDGILYPCARFNSSLNWTFGTVENPNYENVKNFWKKYLNAITFVCHQCWAWPLCHGICPWEIMNFDGSFTMNDTYCFHKKSQYEHAAYIYAKCGAVVHHFPDEKNQ